MKNFDFPYIGPPNIIQMEINDFGIMHTWDEQGNHWHQNVTGGVVYHYKEEKEGKQNECDRTC
jgi:hypothetical protein